MSLMLLQKLPLRTKVSKLSRPKKVVRQLAKAPKEISRILSPRALVKFMRCVGELKKRNIDDIFKYVNFAGMEMLNVTAEGGSDSRFAHFISLLRMQLDSFKENTLCSCNLRLVRFRKFMSTLKMKEPSATCLLYTSPSPRDSGISRMPSSA